MLRSILVTAYADEYVDYLDVCVSAFIEASKNALDAKSKQQVGSIKLAAQNCYKLWPNLAKYIEAMALADALAGVHDAIDQINAMDLAIKRRLEARKLNKSSGREDDASVNIVELNDAPETAAPHQRESAAWRISYAGTVNRPCIEIATRKRAYLQRKGHAFRMSLSFANSPTKASRMCQRRIGEATAQRILAQRHSSLQKPQLPIVLP